MNTKEAIKILELHGDIIIKISDKEYHRTYPCDPDRSDKKQVRCTQKKNEIFHKDIISPRELIRLARMSTSDSRSLTTMKKNLKEADNSKNRSATKRAIVSEEFDNLHPKRKARPENPYNWD